MILQVDINIPIELSARSTSFNLYTVIAIVVCLVSLAASRYGREDVFKNIGLAVIKGKGLRSFVKESLPNNEWSSHFLVLNYFSALFLILILVLNYVDIPQLSVEQTAIFIPIIYVAWQAISMGVSSALTGEHSIFQTFFNIKLVHIKLAGIVYFVGAIIWMLNPEISEAVIFALIIFSLLDVLFIWLKAAILSLQQGAVWYYIILYLCTLEILPFLVIYYGVREIS